VWSVHKLTKINEANYIRSFLASRTAANAVDVDAVVLVDAGRPVDDDVTVAAAGVNGCDVLNSCAFKCSLKFFGFDGDRLRE